MLDLFLSQSGFLSILGVFAIGSMGALMLRKNDELANLWGNGCATLGSLLGLGFSGGLLLTGSSFNLKFPSSLPLLELSIRIDPLSAFFMAVISLIATLGSIYALGYVKHYYKKYDLGVLGFFYNLFIASMILVVTANHALFFLIAWEIMSLASYFLVVYERHKPASIKAGSLYFIMTHAGTAFIIMAFLLLYKVTGSFDFDTIRGGVANISPLIKALVFVAALIGFGTKAGVIPLHIWLPSAHPASPSHVSALMSGVMIKTGIYMLARFCWDFLPSLPLWCGLVVLAIGAISSLLGVLYALSEHDIKRLLAYHSIENIGIILLGLGSSMIFLSAGMKTFAVLGLVAALFHTLNHATFKALLFMAAGSVITKTHTQNIEEFGGLIKKMPQTALYFLIGSMAISALPPFNGFFSEWLTFQAMFQGVATFGLFTKLALLLSIGALAFTGGLAAACFVKAFGATFLARPRSEEAKHATEVGFSLRLGMALLALLTIVLGLAAGTVSKMLAGIAQSLSNFGPMETSAVQFGFGAMGNGFATVSAPALFTALVAGTALLAGIVIALTLQRKIQVGRTWDCGTDLTPRMEITATGFSRSIIRVFKGVLKPSLQTEIEYDDSNLRYFPKAGNVSMELKDVYQAYFYKPLFKGVDAVAQTVKKIQGGNINAYILYILVTLITLLLFLVV